MRTKKRRRVTSSNTAAAFAGAAPRFISDADQRHSIVKEAKRRLIRLQEECGADSYQKELLTERAIFLVLQLETMEINGYEGKPCEHAVHTQMTNSLMGILKTLGLTKRIKEVPDLQTYLKAKERDEDDLD
jgi:hypothetical protein